MASALRQAGHRVHLLDLCFEADQESRVDEAISGFQPEVIGISFRNLEMMAYFRNMSFLHDLRAVVRVCLKESDAVIMLGGSGFSLMPKEILDYTRAQMGVVGEGEWTMAEVLSRMESGSKIRDVAGLVLGRDAPAFPECRQDSGSGETILPGPPRLAYSCTAPPGRCGW